MQSLKGRQSDNQRHCRDASAVQSLKGCEVTINATAGRSSAAPQAELREAACLPSGVGALGGGSGLALPRSAIQRAGC